MERMGWLQKRLALLAIAGGVMFQAGSCIDTLSYYVMDAIYTQVADDVVDLLSGGSSDDDTDAATEE